MRDFYTTNWNLILIFLLGLVPILWFKDGYLIAKGDIFPHWFNSKMLFYDSFLWESTNGGLLSDWPKYQIFGLLWHFFQAVHIPVNVIQIIFEIFYFAGAGFAMYFLSATIYKNQPVTALISSIFYMFNFVMIIRTLNFAYSWILVFLPILLALYVRIVEDLRCNKNPYNNIILFAINSSILTSFASNNPPLLAVIFIAFTSLFLYYFIIEKNLRIKTIKNLVILSAASLLLNIWWIIPFLFSLISIGLNSSAIDAVTDVGVWGWTHSRASFLNLFWLNGTWAWRPEYFPYIDAYSKPILKLLVFVPMLLAFSGFLFRNEDKKINSYFGIIVIFLMFLSKGLHPPFGNINLFLYNHIPGFFLFREPFMKFYIILIIFLALLIGSSSNSIVKKIERSQIKNKQKIHKLFLIFIISTFLISAFPLITGDVITKETERLPFSSYVCIPSHWYEMDEYVSSKEDDFKVLLTPNNDFYQMPYKWGYYGTDILAFRLIEKPILQHQIGYVANENYDKIVTELYNAIENSEHHTFINLLRILNSRYILQRNDILWDYDDRNITSSKKIKDFFDNEADIKLEKNFGELDLYRASSVNFLPHIYSPTKPILINGSIEDAITLISSNKITVDSNAFLLSEQISLSRWNSVREYNDKRHLNTQAPVVFFQKINPTRYEVKIENATEPFILVFSETYNPLWKIYSTNSFEFNTLIAEHLNNSVREMNHELRFTPRDILYLIKNPLNDENHFLVNGYANAWYIEPREVDPNNDGKFNLTIYFWPQSLFYMGLFISVMTFIFCTSYFVYKWRKEKTYNISSR